MRVVLVIINNNVLLWFGIVMQWLCYYLFATVVVLVSFPWPNSPSTKKKQKVWLEFEKRQNSRWILRNKTADHFIYFCFFFFFFFFFCALGIVLNLDLLDFVELSYSAAEGFPPPTSQISRCLRCHPCRRRLRRLSIVKCDEKQRRGWWFETLAD